MLHPKMFSACIARELTRKYTHAHSKSNNIRVINALMLEAVRISETSVYFNDTTLRYIQKAVIFMFTTMKTIFVFVETSRLVLGHTHTPTQ
jgi:hypothetical protein